MRVGWRRGEHNNSLPSLPSPNIRVDGEKITHNYGSTDPCPLPGTQVEHFPAHVNIETPGEKPVRVRQDGKPLFGDQPTRKQRKVIQCNKNKIRSSVKKLIKWINYHHPK